MTLLSLCGNALGFAMIVASALVAGVGGFVLKLADPLVMMGWGNGRCPTRLPVTGTES